MAERATIIWLDTGRQCIAPGDPVFDAEAGTLSILFSDSSSRTFNWNHVVDYYWATEEETEKILRSVDDDDS
jgi:hypothetical protein